ncbi:hypothetical protein PoB_000890200 [Plakobranchus ocellatus]|uniref:Aspartic peptidase DDI1-type domain-containing protein n=1 Tax=Plakobranchus ocellatus TaxID=259542 RepID=A0AAV3YHT7_9GAST|nr:hypothetical protein PoB_000890200 [Plakobranchus ocellatus]
MELCMNRIFPFSSGQPLEVVGKLQAKVQYKDTSRIVSFVVVKTTEIPIIGWNTCQALGLLKAVNKLQKEDSRKGMLVFEIEISGRHTEILADCGASVNILPEQVYNALPTQPALELCMNTCASTSDQFSDVFSGLRKLQDHKIKLHID